MTVNSSEKELMLKSPVGDRTVRPCRVPCIACMITLIIFVSGCKYASTSSTPGESAGIITLSISPVPRLIPSPTEQDYIDAINLAYNTGARGQFVSYRWSDLEPSMGLHRFSDISRTLEYLGNGRGLGILLGLQVVNTNVKETPSDLLTAPFDSVRMKQRFHALVDSLAPYLNRHVYYLSIGNEVDVYCSLHPDQWSAYKNFYDDAVRYIHLAIPWVRVGVTVTFNGAVGPDAGRVSELTSSSDVYILTYYPLASNFIVRDPTSPQVDFPQMISLAGLRLLIVQEAGYPSAQRLGSSEQQQTDFVTYVFSAWSAAGRQQQFLNFFALHDFSEQLCDSLLHYYGAPDTAANFKAYLGSLGLRRADGTPKLSWQALTNAARNYIR